MNCIKLMKQVLSDPEDQLGKSENSFFLYSADHFNQSRWHKGSEVSSIKEEAPFFAIVRGSTHAIRWRQNDAAMFFPVSRSLTYDDSLGLLSPFLGDCEHESCINSSQLCRNEILIIRGAFRAPPNCNVLFSLYPYRILLEAGVTLE